MRNIPTYLQVLTAIFTIAVLLGAIYVGFRSSYNTARIAALREDNEDLRNRVDDHDKALTAERNKNIEQQAQHDRETATLRARIEAVESKNQILESMVIQRAEVEEAKRLVQEHHDATMDALTEIQGMLREK